MTELSPRKCFTDEITTAGIRTFAQDVEKSHPGKQKFRDRIWTPPHLTAL